MGDSKPALKRKGHKDKLVKYNVLEDRLQKSERKMQQIERANKLMGLAKTQDYGYLQVDSEDENFQKTCDYTQDQIVEELDFQTRAKRFDLTLDQYGPYSVDYTYNSKYLLIGGKKGHVATFNWRTGNLGFEINVNETVRDVKFLHNETMLAVAQKKYVYIYNNVGQEIHCLKKMHRTKKLDFLRHHFLLVGINEAGYLYYQDTSIGKEVSCVKTTKNSPCEVLEINKQNGLTMLGHTNGNITMWCPNNNESPSVKLNAHKASITGISVDQTGLYMATCGFDGKLKIWDARKLEPMYEYTNVCPPSANISFSQTGLLATTFGSEAVIWKDITQKEQEHPYLIHRMPRGNAIKRITFCPYEDLLCIGHSNGISSIVVPGAGEANFDTFEANPFETKAQRKEAEVQMLLNKLQPETICFEDGVLGSIVEDEKDNELDLNIKVNTKKRSRLSSSIRKQIIKEKLIKSHKLKKELREHTKKK